MFFSGFPPDKYVVNIRFAAFDVNKQFIDSSVENFLCKRESIRDDVVFVAAIWSVKCR